MVYIFGNDYSLTIVMPFVLILLVLIFFLVTYLRDNIGNLKLFKKKKKKEKKKELIDFNKEFRILKRQVSGSTSAESLNSISSLIKKYIGYRLNISKEFSFEELPRNKLSLQMIEFTKRLSDLKYSGREVERAEVNHLLHYLSKIIKATPKEKKELPMLRLPIFPKIILPKFPKIHIKLPKRKHIYVHKEEQKPIHLDIPMPKKVIINLSDLFKKPKRRLEEHEILEKQQKIIALINQVRQNITDTEKALRYCDKALEINQNLPKHKYSSKLKALHKEILKSKERGIRKTEIEVQKEVRLKEEKQLAKIRDKLLRRIKLSRKNIQNYDKSLLLYKKSYELAKSLPKSEFKTELKDLYHDILITKQRQIQLIQKEQEKRLRLKEQEKQRKINSELEKEREKRQIQLEKQRKIRLRQLERERKITQKEKERRQTELEKQRKLQSIEKERQKQIKLRELEKERIIKIREQEEQRKLQLIKDKEREKRQIQFEKQKQIKFAQQEREKTIRKAELEKE